MITVDFFGVGPEYQSELSAVAAEVYKVEKMKGNATVELSFASSDEIRELNRSSRGVDRETDVLSFPALDEIKPFTKKNYPFEYDPARRSVELGSIVICREVAEAQAKNTVIPSVAKRAICLRTGCCTSADTTISKSRTKR